MSDYQDGYDRGYQDGLDDNYNVVERLSGFLGMIIDTTLGVTEREEEWREGYEAGYEDGKRAREENE